MGAAIQEFLQENPEVKREDLFVTTKVYPGLGDVAQVGW
jgi:diketogulonate reductase-like aldo/keto reductase